MSIQKARLANTTLSSYNRQNSLLTKLPREILHRCFSMLDLNALLVFPKISKECHVLTNNPEFWIAIANALNLNISPPINKVICEEAYKLKKECQKAIYQVLKLNEKLGRKVCQKIDDLPIWKGGIVFDDEDKTSLNLSQFFEQPLNDEKNHFFKTVIDGDLYLLLIRADRLTSKVIWFNSSFDLNSKNEKEYLLKKFGIGFSSHAYIVTSDKSDNKRRECEWEWREMRKQLCRIFELNTNLEDLDLDTMLEWMNLGSSFGFEKAS